MSEMSPSEREYQSMLGNLPEQSPEMQRIAALEAEIAQLCERIETAERERDEAVQHYQEVGQHWHDAEARAEAAERERDEALTSGQGYVSHFGALVRDRDAAEALNVELRAALENVLHALTLTHGLVATDRPDILYTAVKDEYFWGIDNKNELMKLRAILARTPEAALKQRQAEQAVTGERECLVCASCGWDESHSPQCRWFNPGSENLVRKSQAFAVHDANGGETDA